MNYVPGLGTRLRITTTLAGGCPLRLLTFGEDGFLITSFKLEKDGKKSFFEFFGPLFGFEQVRNLSGSALTSAHHVGEQMSEGDLRPRLITW